jgi:hypothetical protein
VQKRRCEAPPSIEILCGADISIQCGASLNAIGLAHGRSAGRTPSASPALRLHQTPMHAFLLDSNIDDHEAVRENGG